MFVQQSVSKSLCVRGGATPAQRKTTESAILQVGTTLCWHLNFIIFVAQRDRAVIRVHTGRSLIRAKKPGLTSRLTNGMIQI